MKYLIWFAAMIALAVGLLLPLHRSDPARMIPTLALHYADGGSTMLSGLRVNPGVDTRTPPIMLPTVCVCPPHTEKFHPLIQKHKKKISHGSAHGLSGSHHAPHHHKSHVPHHHKSFAPMHLTGPPCC